MENSITIENDLYLAEINYKGAEPKRLYSKKEKREILWNGDAKYWGRHAPLLFPIVGKVNKGSYIHENNSFEIGQHGFARDLEWNLIDKGDTSCQFQLIENDWSLRKFPFSFEIIATFNLNKNGLDIQYKVTNEEPQSLFFSIGTHPAFNCPWNSKEHIENYALEFEKEENAGILLLNSTGLRTGQKKPFLNSNRLVLSEGLFANDALVFDDLKSQSLSIKNLKDQSGVKISWQNFPHLGIWKPLEAPFLCIEPWHGMADVDNFTGELKEKYGIIELQESKSFTCGYQIECLPN